MQLLENQSPFAHLTYVMTIYHAITIGTNSITSVADIGSNKMMSFVIGYMGSDEVVDAEDDANKEAAEEVSNVVDEDKGDDAEEEYVDPKPLVCYQIERDQLRQLLIDWLKGKVEDAGWFSQGQKQNMYFKRYWILKVFSQELVILVCALPEHKKARDKMIEDILSCQPVFKFFKSDHY